MSNLVWATLDRLVELLAVRRHALIGLAVTRIGFGVTILLDLAIHIPLRHELWGTDSWVGADQRAMSATFPLNVLVVVPADWYLDLVYAAYALTALAFTLGWRTRLMTPLVWVLMWSFQDRNQYLTHGGDNLARILLFYMMFAQLDACLSIRRLPGRDAARRQRIRQVLRPVGTVAHNTAVAACLMQLAVLYTASAMFKIQGEKWQEGTAVYYITRVAAYDSWPEIARIFALSPLVLTMVTYTTVFAQLLFLGSLLRRWSRHLVLAVLVGMHAGIGFLMGLPVFSMFMIAADLMIITDAEWLDLREGLRARLIRRPTAPPSGRAPMDDHDTTTSVGSRPATVARAKPVAVGANPVAGVDEWAR